MDTACNVLLIAASAVIFQNIQWVITGILRSAGDSKFTATSSLISVAFLRPIISYVLIYLVFTHTNSVGEIEKGLGIYGAWVAQLIDQCIRMSFNLWRFHSRKWTKLRV